MQGGGRPGSRILRGAVSLVGNVGRPLVLAFAVCGGAAVYFSMPYEPHLSAVSGAAALVFGLWMFARRWWPPIAPSRLSRSLSGSCSAPLPAAPGRGWFGRRRWPKRQGQSCWRAGYRKSNPVAGETLYRDGRAQVGVVPEPCGARLWTACPPVTKAEGNVLPPGRRRRQSYLRTSDTSRP